MFVSFTHPLYLWFFIAVSILVFLHFYTLKNIRGRALRFANFEAIARVKGIDIYSKSIFVLVLDILILSLLVLSISGMVIYRQVTASSFSFVIAIDNSESMSAVDLVPDRLSAAKETATDFVSNLPFETYVGVLSFSGNSEIENRLTKDKQELISSIDNIEISLIGGTDIYDAILNSVNLLRKEDNKAIILLSDGQINTGNIREAINYAIDNKALVHTIGIGTPEGGTVSYGLSKLDEESLKSLAYSTGGKYFNGVDKNSLEESFNSIVGVTEKVGEIDLSFYLIIAVVFLFLLKQFLIGTNRIEW